MSSKPKKVAIGIDLGSSKCCVGVVRNGKVEIIENERGNKTTPSYVAFTDTERLIGEDAKDQATLNPTNTVFGVKRIMGRKGDDPIVKSYVERIPFVVTTDEQPVINVTYKEREEFLHPQQITAMLLTKMKEMAEIHLRCGVHDAVISVPACFTNAQRQTTKDAAQIAGLNVLRLINEPTAAAIAYEANRRTDAAETVVVVDFGGGKLDVSVIDIAKRKVTVKAVSGVADLGGTDIDDNLKEHFVSEMIILDKKAASSARVSSKMRLACEELKRSLTVVSLARESVDCFSEGDSVLTLTKEKFRLLFQDRAESSFKPCLSSVLKYADCTKEQISRIILVGGSTRIPMVQEFLQYFFTERQVDQSVNPDEAVAYGAAVQAALLAGDHTLQNVQVSDVVPYGVTVGDTIVFQACDRIPKDVTIEASTFLSESHSVLEQIPSNQGNDEHATRAVGTLCLSKEFGRAASFLSHLSFVVDDNGIFDISTVLKANSVYNQVGGNHSESLHKDKISLFTTKESQFRKDASDMKERVGAMTELESYCFSLKLRIEGYLKISETNQKLFNYILQKCNDHLDWLDSVKNPETFEVDERIGSLQSLEDYFNKTVKQIENKEKMIESFHVTKTSKSNEKKNLPKHDVTETDKKVVRVESESETASEVTDSGASSISHHAEVIPDKNKDSSDPHDARNKAKSRSSICNKGRTKTKEAVDKTFLNAGPEHQEAQGGNARLKTVLCLDAYLKPLRELRQSPMSGNVAIGIDLGTTNSCVAAVRDGRVEIIANDDMGYRVTPSCVAFTDEERLVGDAAQFMAYLNPKNTVFDVKRLIGRKFDDESVQNGIKNWPFTVVNHEGNPKVEVEYKNERKTYTPEEISAMVLGKMKDTAESYLGCPVKDAVITVPAYFNDSQRQATIDAGKIAGLNVLGILNEPTAAAIAYGVASKIKQERNILIYNLEKTTLDVTVLTIENGVFDVQGVGSNTNLGGRDIDTLLVKHFAEKFQIKYELDLLKDHRACENLRKKCKEAKRNLSFSMKVMIEIECLLNGIDFMSSLSRKQMEHICSDLFSETMEVVKAVLKDSKLEKTQIHEIILTGGSTRIPKIYGMLEEFFEGKEFLRTICPEETVAYGAALHAAMLTGHTPC